MNHNFNMSFDPKLRQQFTRIVGEYGLTAPQAFKLFANQVVKTGVIPLSFDWAKNPHTLSTRGEQLLQESLDDFEQGNTERFSSLDELNQAIAEINRGEP